MKYKVDLSINRVNKSTNAKKVSFACNIVINIVEKCFFFILLYDRRLFDLFDLFKLSIFRNRISFSFLIF